MSQNTDVILEPTVQQLAQAPGLTAAQIAAHVGTQVWNVTYELQQGDKGKPGRLRGTKTFDGGPGRGGQWRINRNTYLAWLGVVDPQTGQVDDTELLDRHGLPILLNLEQAGWLLDMDHKILRTMIRQARWPHAAFGRTWYLTHNQLQRIRVQLIEDSRAR
jgi:hypothetical protein